MRKQLNQSLAIETIAAAPALAERKKMFF